VVDGVGLARLREQLTVLEKNSALRLAVVLILEIRQKTGREHKKALLPVLDHASLLCHEAAK
jgi:hypothetical protein